MIGLVITSQKPNITFIVPIYNKIGYLEECLQSILEQSVTPFQIVCVDDASTDGSYELLSSFAFNSRFVILRNTKNEGPGPSRNKGLTVASGEYIRFVDADDILPRQSSIQLLEAAEKSKVALVRGNIEYFNEEEVPGLFAPVSYGKPVEFANHESLRIPWYFTSYLIKRTALSASKAKFPNLRVGEDSVFLARLLCYSKYIATIGQVVYRYRSRQGRALNYTRSTIEDYIRHARLVKGVFLYHGYQRCWTAYKEILVLDFNYVLSKSAMEPLEAEALRKRLPD